jgi:hypothetical protein
LLSVPKYDFNWQRDYVLVEPVDVPAGSKLIHTTVYDNSAQNPGNPDPSRRVPWGLQTWDEMLYGSVRFRWKDETIDNLLHDPVMARIQQAFGYMDQNRNDLLELDEMAAGMRQFVERQLPVLDQDNNGALSLDEFRAISGGLGR